MTAITQEDHLTSEGVAFSVAVEYQNYACLVSRAALADLIKMSDDVIEPFDAYKAYKNKIHGVARRLVAAGIGGVPVVLQPKHF